MYSEESGNGVQLSNMGGASVSNVKTTTMEKKKKKKASSGFENPIYYNTKVFHFNFLQLRLIIHSMIINYDWYGMIVR